MPEPTLLKKSLWCSCFTVNFVKFLRTPFFIEELWWLHLSLTGQKIIDALTGNSQFDIFATRWVAI